MRWIDISRLSGAGTDDLLEDQHIAGAQVQLAFRFRWFFLFLCFVVRVTVMVSFFRGYVLIVVVVIVVVMQVFLRDVAIRAIGVSIVGRSRRRARQVFIDKRRACRAARQTTLEVAPGVKVYLVVRSNSAISSAPIASNTS